MHRHTVNIHEAKTHFSKLIQAVLNGEEIIIAKAGHPVVKLSPIAPQKKELVFGGMKGEIWLSDDFNDPLSDDLLALFEGKKDENFA